LLRPSQYYGYGAYYRNSNRRLDNKINVFEGIHKNWYFIGINLITIAGQVTIIFFGGSALSAVPLSKVQWGISLVLGAISLVIGVAVRLIPDELVRTLLPVKLGRRFVPHVRAFGYGSSEWDEVRENIRRELAFHRKVRNSRVNRLGFKFLGGSATITDTWDGRISPSAHPSENPSLNDSGMRSRSNSAVRPAAAMAGIIAGSIAVWSPIGPTSSENGS